MATITRYLCLVMAFLVLTCAWVQAAVPDAINVEVALKEAGEPLTGTHTVRDVYTSSAADVAV